MWSTCGGRTARAVCVASCSLGDEDDRRDVRVGRDRRRAGRRRRRVAGVAAPRDRHAAADARRRVVGVPLELGRQVRGHVEVDLEGSSHVLVTSTPRRSESTWAATTPATIADADDPSPRLCGIPFRATRHRPAGMCVSRRAKPCAMARTTRCVASRGTSSAPSPDTETLQAVALVDVDVVLVPQPEREPDRVEPRAEVGGAPRDADPDRGSTSRAYRPLTRRGRARRPPTPRRPTPGPGRPRTRRPAAAPTAGP